MCSKIVQTTNVKYKQNFFEIYFGDFVSYYDYFSFECQISHEW